MKIVVEQVSKKYKDKVAIDNLSFEIEGPAIVGFLGHNGAGKTTLLNIFASLISATSGKVLINGEEVFDNTNAMKQICFIAETDNFFNQLTISQLFKSNQLFYENWDQEYASQLLNRFKLNEKLKIKNLSKGMTSALGIIMGLACRTPIVIFDEPYIGLDAASRSLFYDLLLEEYTENPRLFIMSTHLIDEVADLFNEVIILQEGKLLLKDSYMNIQQKLFKVKGKKQDVESFINGKKVIHHSSFLNEVHALVKLNNQEAAQLKTHSVLSFEPIKLQELMILLSKQYREEI